MITVKSVSDEMEIFDDGDIYINFDGYDQMINGSELNQSEREEICKASESLAKLLTYYKRKLKEI